MLGQVVREKGHINNMQFGFMVGHGTADVIFLERQMQEKQYLGKKKFYFTFVDLETGYHGKSWGVQCAT